MIAFEVDDVRLKSGHRGATHSEHVKEIVPERLFLGTFGPVARVFTREANRTVANLIPREMILMGCRGFFSRFF